MFKLSASHEIVLVTRGQSGLTGEARQTPPLPSGQVQTHSLDETRRRGQLRAPPAPAGDQQEFISKYKETVCNKPQV